MEAEAAKSSNSCLLPMGEAWRINFGPQLKNHFSRLAEKRQAEAGGTYNVVLHGNRELSPETQPPFIPPPLAGADQVFVFSGGEPYTLGSEKQFTEDSDPGNITLGLLTACKADKGELPGKVKSTVFQESFQKAIRPGLTTVEDLMGATALAAQESRPTPLQGAKLFDRCLPGQMVQDCMGRRASVDVISASKMLNQFRRGTLDLRRLSYAWACAQTSVSPMSAEKLQAWLRPRLVMQADREKDDEMVNMARDRLRVLCTRNIRTIQAANLNRKVLTLDTSICQTEAQAEWDRASAIAACMEEKIRCGASLQAALESHYTFYQETQSSITSMIWVLLMVVYVDAWERFPELDKQLAAQGYYNRLSSEAVWRKVVTTELGRSLVYLLLPEEPSLCVALGYASVEDLVSDQVRFLWKLSLTLSLHHKHVFVEHLDDCRFASLQVDCSIPLGLQHHTPHEILTSIHEKVWSVRSGG